MIERHITFTVQPDKAGDFEQFFAEQYAPAMSKSPGFVRVDLLREAESPAQYQMVLRWQDADAATGWRTSVVHQGLQPTLASLAATVSIQVYDVVG